MKNYQWVDFKQQKWRGTDGPALRVSKAGNAELNAAGAALLGHPHEVGFLVDKEARAFAIVAPPSEGGRAYKISSARQMSMKSLMRYLGASLPLHLTGKWEDGMLVFELPPAE